MDPCPVKVTIRDNGGYVILGPYSFLLYDYYKAEGPLEGLQDILRNIHLCSIQPSMPEFTLRSRRSLSEQNVREGDDLARKADAANCYGLGFRV